MHITDLEGMLITITDLAKAIEQAEAFRNYSHLGEARQHFDRQRQAYWNDIYAKLLQLKISPAG